MKKSFGVLYMSGGVSPKITVIHSRAASLGVLKEAPTSPNPLISPRRPLQLCFPHAGRLPRDLTPNQPGSCTRATNPCRNQGNETKRKERKRPFKATYSLPRPISHHYSRSSFFLFSFSSVLRNFFFNKVVHLYFFHRVHLYFFLKPINTKSAAGIFGGRNLFFEKWAENPHLFMGAQNWGNKRAQLVPGNSWISKY